MLTDAPLTFQRQQRNGADTVVYVLNGPLTLRNMFDLQSELRTAPSATLTVLDLSGVPYMDSAGMGLVMNQYVHCQTRGVRFVVAGANSRVLDLFKITKVDCVLPLAATAEEAETRS